MQRTNSTIRKRTTTTATPCCWAYRSGDVRNVLMMFAFRLEVLSIFNVPQRKLSIPICMAKSLRLLSEAPLNLHTQAREFWDMSLEQAVQMSLQNSPVLRDLGGFVLRSPQNDAHGAWTSVVRSRSALWCRGRALGIRYRIRRAHELGKERSRIEQSVARRWHELLQTRPRRRAVSTAKACCDRDPVYLAFQYRL